MKNMKKSLISTLEEIKANLSRDTDSDLAKIQNVCREYMNETQDRKLEDCFEEYLSEDITKDYIEHEIKNCGLIRLNYLVGDTDFRNDYYRLNAYGNIENIEKSDLEYTIDELIYRLQD